LSGGGHLGVLVVEIFKRRVGNAHICPHHKSAK
jgi:hypothetical protein